MPFGIDSLGCTIVGGITAVGGGTVRDLIIGQLPVIWIAEVDYLWLLLATTAKSKSSLLQSSSSGLRTLAQRGLHSSLLELNSLLIPAYLTPLIYVSWKKREVAIISNVLVMGCC